MKRLPHNQLETMEYRYIRQVRLMRNMTQKDFSTIMGLNIGTLSRLESGLIEFTPYYQELFKEACKRLRVTGAEVVAIRKVLEIKKK